MKCPYCGANVRKDLEHCEYCDSYIQPEIERTAEEKPQRVIVEAHIVNQSAPEPPRSAPVPVSPYSRWAAFFLCLCFGWMGMHRFYVGKIGTGMLWLISFGFFGLGYALDLLMLLTGTFCDKQGRKLH